MLFDRESVKQRLIEGLKAKNNWANILETSFLDGLITPFAEEVNREALYMEYLLREAKWDLAQNITSLTSQSTINGYIPKRRIGATGTVRISTSETFDSAYTNTITIPRNTLLTGGDLDFAVLETNALPGSTNYVDVQVIQGTPMSDSFIAQGLDFEEFIISSDLVENEYYRVYVNNELWTEVEDIREGLEDSKVYQIVNEFDYSGIRLRFGNNITGKKLSNGYSVLFEYYHTEGADGNIESLNIVDTVESSLYDVYGNKISEIFCKNITAIVGGSEIEGVEEIRKKAPQINQSLNAATTNESYKALIENIPFVYKAVVSGALEYNEDNGYPYNNYIPAMENRVLVSAFTDSGTQLSEDQRLSIVSSLRERKAPTDIIDFQEVEFIKMKFYIDAYAISRNITLTYLTSSIESYLAEYYSIFNWEFKKPIFESDYKSAIDQVVDENGLKVIDHHDTTIKLISEPVFGNAYIASLKLYLAPIVEGSIEVWAKNNNDETPVWTLIGVDDGVEGFTPEAGFTLTDSSINYSLGTGVLVVNSGLTGDFQNIELKVFYSLPSLNIIPSKKNQILMYGESEIHPYYMS